MFEYINLIGLILIALVFVVNTAWAIVWYYRKTQTLEYKIKRFVKKEKIHARLRKNAIQVSADKLLQLFLRCGNENFREYLKADYNRNSALSVFDTLLQKEDGMYLVNYVGSKYLNKPAPTAPPIDELGDDLQEL